MKSRGCTITTRDKLAAGTDVRVMGRHGGDLLDESVYNEIRSAMEIEYSQGPDTRKKPQNRS